jgi:sulfite reductase (NADPH) flavoprotein alpha-component
LAGLAQNNAIEARIVPNKKFHAPEGYRSLILVSNGTGIAPFIGMAVENKSHAKIDLFWGGKSAEDYKLYEEELLSLQSNGKISSLRTIFSENKGLYVQKLIAENEQEVCDALKEGTSIMICGSISMGQGVLEEIGLMCRNNNMPEIDYYRDNGQIKMDCY